MGSVLLAPFPKRFGTIAKAAERVVEGAEQTGAIAEHLLSPLFRLAAKEILQRAERVMARCFPKFGEDDGLIELLSLRKGAISLDPEEAAAPPEIFHVGSSPCEGGGDFVPDFSFGNGPHFKP